MYVMGLSKEDLPQVPIVEHALGVGELGIEAHGLADQELFPGLINQPDHLGGILHPGAHRLGADHMLASLQGSDNVFGMQVIGRIDPDHLDILASHQMPVIGGPERNTPRFGQMPDLALCGRTQRPDLESRARVAIDEQQVRPHADSNHADADTFLTMRCPSSIKPATGPKVPAEPPPSAAAVPCSGPGSFACVHRGYRRRRPSRCPPTVGS